MSSSVQNLFSHPCYNCAMFGGVLEMTSLGAILVFSKAAMRKSVIFQRNDLTTILSLNFVCTIFVLSQLPFPQDVNIHFCFSCAYKWLMMLMMKLRMLSDLWQSKLKITIFNAKDEMRVRESSKRKFIHLSSSTRSAAAQTHSFFAIKNDKAELEQNVTLWKLRQEWDLRERFESAESAASGLSLSKFY